MCGVYKGAGGLKLNLKDIVGNIFYTEQKKQEADEQKTAELQRKANKAFGKNTVSTSNPFLDRNGNLLNSGLNYQQILNSPGVSQRVKEFITQATGLTPAVAQKTETPKTALVQEGASRIKNDTGGAAAAAEAAPRAAREASKTGNTVVEAAQKYMGTPYVWGGESMSEGGMDCSGFVYNALKDSGHNVGRTTAEGYRKGGTSVSKDSLKPGDLVFYGNGTATHVAIYAGDGKIIHSSGNEKNSASNPGKGVSVTNLDYRKDYLGAKRY